MKIKLVWKANPVKLGPLVGQLSESNEDTISWEDEINAWLQNHPHIKIADIKQSAAGGSFGPMLWSISVWYEEGDS